VVGDVVEELRLAMENVKTILAAAGSSLAQALKVTLYLKDMNDFARVNEAYKDYFGPVFPARTTIQAGRLPFDIKVEVDVIAHRHVAKPE
jgi:2-iminobutanoate/2-iminopropanoate deaminase